MSEGSNPHSIGRAVPANRKLDLPPPVIDPARVLPATDDLAAAPAPAKRPTRLIVAFVAVLVATVGFWWRVYPNLHGPVVPVPAVRTSAPAAVVASHAAAVTKSATPSASSMTPAEKAARIERIKRDYDEIRSKAAIEYSAAGSSFPGGVSAFLRQLALLEREKRRDLLTVLTSQELEDLELRETHAGQQVQQWLGDSAATDEQRRTVFRLQRDFDDQYALSFDLSPQLLLARERDRQALEEQVHGVLGEALFPAWIRSEGSDYDGFSQFAAQHGLPATAPLALWRIRNAFVLARLEIAANPALTPDDVQAATARVAQQAETDARAALGPAGNDATRQNVLSWLPKP